MKLSRYNELVERIILVLAGIMFLVIWMIGLIRVMIMLQPFWDGLDAWWGRCGVWAGLTVISIFPIWFLCVIIHKIRKRYFNAEAIKK